MTKETVQGSVTLRKLRTGATATITLSSTMQLFQLYTIKPNNDIDCVPNWSGSNSHPVVSVNAVSSQGSVKITDVDWDINGTQATSISGITAIGPNGTSLDINTNLVGVLNRNSGTLTARITFVDDSGHTTTIEKSEIIRIQQAVSDGYTVMINANRTWVDDSHNATLTAVCYQGTLPVPSDSISYKWYNTTDTSVSNIGTGETLTVGPSMVHGSQLFVCRAYDGNNQEVDAEGVNIVDNSDPYIISSTAQQYKGNTAVGSAQANVTSVNVASDNDKTTLTYKVTNQSGVAYSGTPKSWVVKKYHADTMKLIDEVAGAGYTKDKEDIETNLTSYNHRTATNASTVSIDILDADYVSVGNGTVSAHDTEVVATAQATL